MRIDHYLMLNKKVNPFPGLLLGAKILKEKNHEGETY
jgi:hypothetical protein